jgi:D-inositol-3-phosphate glycosyltransferase
MPERIAMLSIHTCPLATLGGKETGGMNVYVRELTRALSHRGLAVDVFTRSQNALTSRISTGRGALGPQGRVIHLPAGPEEPYHKDAIFDHLAEFTHNVKEFARQEHLHYDLIHSHYWLSGLAARDLHLAWDVPIVQMFHTLGELKNQVAQSPAEFESGRRIAAEREIIGFADRLVAATAHERDQMEALYGADPATISIVPPGVDLERFHPRPCEEARAEIGVPSDCQVILFVGRIQPIKGIDTLIRAMALVFEREPELRQQVYLCIIGGDPDADLARDESELRRLAQLRDELGIGNLVLFLGSKDQDSLPCHYSAASMVVVPSHYESFGMVALEAMAAGVPVIASDVGGLSFSVSDGFNGYLVPDGDPETLAYKVTLLLKYESLRQQLGEQARRWAERFAWSNIAGEILEVYDKVLARHPIMA